MINDRAYELPNVVYLEAGLYIVRYIPEPEFKFSFWQLSGVSFTSKSEVETPNLISVYQPGEVRAYYLKYPELRIDLPSDLYDIAITRSPIELRAKITSFSKPVADAEVAFYVNGECIDSKLSDGDGYASTIFEPYGENHYTWHVTAEKWGYASSESDEWEFAVVEVTLKPIDRHLLMDLPITIKALVEIDESEIEDASVYFYVDDVFQSSLLTQRTGTASCVLDGVAPGLHTWYVTVWIPGYSNRFSSKMQSFVYNPRLSVQLEHPKDGDTITKPTSEVELRATVRSLDGKVPGVNCSFYIDGELVGYRTTDGRGVTSMKFSPPVEDKEYNWQVFASEPYCLNDTSETWDFYYPVQPPYVEVDDWFSSGRRVDVGSVQRVGFHLRWENGSDAEGAAVRVADSCEAVTDDSGWAIFEVMKDHVCEEMYRITNVTCEGVGEFRNSDDFPIIIWDRVTIELQTEKQRVDVGTNATLIVRAHYEYDYSPFLGKIRYDEELNSDKVIRKTISVEGIDDEKYNLTNFDVNEISLVWDRVKLELHAADSRVQVGTKAEMVYQGSYEYDGEPFIGSIELDKDLRQDNIGEVRYEVRGISDELYNLSTFNSNTVSCVFDDIEIEQKLNTVIPTQIVVETKIQYVYDGGPVTDAKVTVNGVGNNIGSGSYRTVLYSFFPYGKLITEVELDRFDTRIMEIRTFALGNSCVWSGAVLLAIYLVARAIILRKPRKN